MMIVSGVENESSVILSNALEVKKKTRCEAILLAGR